MGVPMEGVYRKMLVDLGHNVRESDLESMKYLCRDIIPRRRQEEIETALDLWEALEERSKLSITNLDFLKFLISSGTEGRTDVGKIISGYERLYRTITDSSTPNLPASPMEMDSMLMNSGQRVPQNVYGAELNREIEFIVMSIGKYWRQFARKLGVKEADIDCVTEEHPRNMREQIRQCIKIWFYQVQDRASKDMLIDALRQCQRNDLVHQLQSGQY